MIKKVGAATLLSGLSGAAVVESTKAQSINETSAPYGNETNTTAKMKQIRQLEL
jgi:hypothetical protein